MNNKILFTLVEEIALQTSVKAAIASYKWLGKGDSNAADQAAVFAMRDFLAKQDVIRGKIVIGEGERDEAPMLYIGEVLGSGSHDFDIAVDPLEGTALCADNKKNSITAIAIGQSGSILHAPDVYMEKIAGGQMLAGKIDLDKTIEENITAVARTLEKDVADVTITILDRPRHKEMIDRARAFGASVSLIQDGDVSAVISVALGNSDLYIGIGGAPEGVLAAAALKTIDGYMQTRLICDTDEKKQRASKMGVVDFAKKYTISDMIKGDVVFAITGVSDGDLCDGVFEIDENFTTSSLVLNSFEKSIKNIELTFNL
ncbi:class II fructose-bisphosphatase [Candidatus Deianiraea vastatrix]|uniref:Fructose-1,6-bisphosphatase n=1 Tax=Candidatus Deianiraea vastatrix TaxID=2163644 RepID=A0A5B8XD61_9RICK|nr:class II fructose-bisphosphatase [Candidatus Deianiraea vastatrix]QED23223.1 Fructose-1,6-bisphosphatase class 2 [Candidatus Deianiraea vastatrix]